MTAQTMSEIIECLERNRPKGATGIYITRDGISYSFRTSKRKFPQNFVPLWLEVLA